MQILASAALLGGEGFLAAHGPAVAHVLGACMGTLNERGTLLVTPRSLSCCTIFHAREGALAPSGMRRGCPPAATPTWTLHSSCPLCVSHDRFVSMFL